MDKLIESCNTTKKVKEKHDDVKNIGSGNYDVLVLGDFISDMDELNYGALDGIWVNMFDCFGKSDQVKKLFDKYKFRPLPHVKMKLKIYCKLVLNVVYTVIEFFIEITHDSIGDDNIRSLI